MAMRKARTLAFLALAAAATFTVSACAALHAAVFGSDTHTAAAVAARAADAQIIDAFNGVVSYVATLVLGLAGGGAAGYKAGRRRKTPRPATK